MVMVYARGWKHYIKRCAIHGLLLGKWARLGFNWQRVYNEISEVHGGSPKTNVYSSAGVRALFAPFATFEAKRRRLGEFFDYRPYNTTKLPTYFRNAARLLNLEAAIGENWMVRAQESTPPPRSSTWDVWLKHY